MNAEQLHGMIGEKTSGRTNGSMYKEWKITIPALTGEEEQIFEVINSQEGDLVV